MNTKKRSACAAVAVAAMTAWAFPAGAQAHEATCSDVLGIDVHGQHVVRDYVMGATSLEWPPAGSVGAAVQGEGAAVPGGPGPGFHFLHGVAPGASFCNEASRSPGFHVG